VLKKVRLLVRPGKRSLLLCRSDRVRPERLSVVVVRDPRTSKRDCRSPSGRLAIRYERPVFGLAEQAAERKAL